MTQVSSARTQVFPDLTYHYMPPASLRASPVGSHYQGDLTLRSSTPASSGYYSPPMTMAPSVQWIRPGRAEDWEPYKGVIVELYRIKKLKDVIETMKSMYSFNATPRQYKTKIKEWGLDDKYTKTWEYIGILKVKRRRDRLDPKRPTEFFLRGKRIDPAAIARFETRAVKRGIITMDESLSDRESIGDDLECRTPIEAYAPQWDYQDPVGYQGDLDYHMNGEPSYPIE